MLVSQSVQVLLLAYNSLVYTKAPSLATRHHFEPLKRGFLQRLTVARVSNTNQLVCTLAKCFAKQIRNAVLCHYVMDVCSRCHHPSTCNASACHMQQKT